MCIKLGLAEPKDKCYLNGRGRCSKDYGLD